MIPKPNKSKTGRASQSQDSNETLAQKIQRYGRSEFTEAVQQHFHKAKKKALSDRDAARGKRQRSA